MNLRLLHRRLAVLMGLAGLVAFSGGAGVEPLSTTFATLALGAALFWHPDSERSTRMERAWLPLAAILVTRALWHVFIIHDDVVIPVVDLLLLLMAAEALRSLDAPNDLRLYALSFALILASTAYRPGIVFLVAFLAYIGLATLALMIGHLRREAERHRILEVPLGRGLIGTTAALSGVVVVVAVFVFVTFPRVSRGWAGRGETVTTSIAGFSDQVSIGEVGSTILGNPQIVLRVEFPDEAPADMGSLHWRGRSYDRFDGVRWNHSGSLPPSAAPTAWYRNRWPAPTVEQRIFGAALEARVLFALHPTLELDADNGVQPLFDNAGDFVYWGSGAPAYTALSSADQPSAGQLRDAENGYTPSNRYFLQLPPLDPAVTALADSLTAGLENRYDKAVAIQSWLRSFTYTRDLPATAGQATLQHFLFERRAGHCEYFSTAMVVLLRSVGIQARNVNGFLGGQWNEFGSYLVVTQNEAHSWVEVWFPGYGWVTFDPTPAGVAGSSQVASWFWPGRILFDGIQHRWNKWVLDYDVADQSGLLARWSGLLGTREEMTREAAGGSPEQRTVGLWGVALLLLALVAGWVWLRRSGPPLMPTTRMYVELRTACRRAGIAVSPGLTPLALVRKIETTRGAASVPSARVVDLYLRARYGQEHLGIAELTEMRAALSAARRHLRIRT